MTLIAFKTFQRKLKSCFLIALTFSGVVITTNTINAQEKLLIGAIPDQHPEKLNRLYTLLSKRLSEELKVGVKYVPVTNYSAAVSAFRTRSLDLVWFGGLTGVQARIQRPDSVVLVQRDIDKEFRTIFIAHKSSNLEKMDSYHNLRTLKGRRLTFGSESSTSGRLMPQYYIEKSGISIIELAGNSPGFSGSHDATIALVQSGSYEVGALNKQVWDSNKITKRIPIDNIKILYVTPPYSDYHWLAQGDLDNRFYNGFTRKLKNLLLSMRRKNKNDAFILELFGANRFVSASKEEYSTIEMIGRKLGKIR